MNFDRKWKDGGKGREREQGVISETTSAPSLSVLAVIRSDCYPQAKGGWDFVHENTGRTDILDVPEPCLSQPEPDPFSSSLTSLNVGPHAKPASSGAAASSFLQHIRSALSSDNLKDETLQSTLQVLTMHCMYCVTARC